jgi:hypothetical protein
VTKTPLDDTGIIRGKWIRCHIHRNTKFRTVSVNRILVVRPAIVSLGRFPFAPMLRLANPPPQCMRHPPAKLMSHPKPRDAGCRASRPEDVSDIHPTTPELQALVTFPCLLQCATSDNIGYRQLLDDFSASFSGTSWEPSEYGWGSPLGP